MFDHREQNIKTAALLNISFTLIELIGGLWTNSLAILSDALHDLGDSFALVISYVLERKARRPRDAKMTFGYARLSLLAALFSAVILVAGSLFILWKTVPRLINPEPVYAPGMIGLAIVGVLFNGAGLMKLKKGESLNERVLSWHFLEDVLGWSAILIGSLIIHFWDNYLIDPLMTFGFTAFILWGVAKNLKETFNIFLQGVPGHIDSSGVRKDLLSLAGIKRIHDVHIWSLDGEKDIFTGHIVVTPELLTNPDQTRRKIKETLEKHHIEHSTVELESEKFCSGTDCEN